jgi:NitT/TauT family transport system ATP-binding protein
MFWPFKWRSGPGHLLVPWKGRQERAKIAVRQLGHTFRQNQSEVVALRDVDIDVHSGQFVCLLGPSGCGKSTLLYALAGHLAPSGGQISIDGRAVKGPSPDRLLLFQQPALFPWLTVRQNLVFPLRAKGLPRAACERIAREFLGRVELQGFEDVLPHQLSGGMRSRVALARALAMDPAVLLMDEPFAALDAQTRAHMHELLASIWTRDRKTVVFVTHNVREALVLGDRVVVMAGQPGRVLQDLEVRLPRPRDPDDARLVQLSREIRDALARPEVAPRPLRPAVLRADSPEEALRVQPPRPEPGALPAGRPRRLGARL